MNEAATLRIAREYVDTPEKWGQGNNLGRKCCAYLAVPAASVDGGASFNSAILPLLRAAELGTPNDLIDWNDAPERTHADILAAFDAAIEASA